MEKIKLNTPIPGPKSSELTNARKKFVTGAIATAVPIFASKAKGAFIEDLDGNVFLDFAGAIGTMNVGHNNDSVVSAIQKQTEELIHSCYSVTYYEPYVKLAEQLCKLTPGNFHKKAGFFNSGAEAVENAVKVARKFTKKSGIISFTRGFHGRTLLTMSLTNKLKPYKYDMGPYAPMIFRASYPYTLHKPKGVSEEDYIDFELQQFKDFFYTGAAPEEIAAVIMEPVQGEGGFVVPPKRFVEEVFRICKEKGILFISDEVQTGFGRTGKMFASEHYNIEPDIITLSKSLGAGIPISAVVGKEEIMDAPDLGELGGTYGGSPLGCVAGLEVIKKIQEDNLAERANQIGEIIKAKCEAIKLEYPQIAEVRGLGAMCAIELMDPNEWEPMPELTTAIRQECFRNGLIILSAGPYGNVLRFLCPLVITDEQLKEGLEVLHKAFKNILG